MAPVGNSVANVLLEALREEGGATQRSLGARIVSAAQSFRRELHQRAQKIDEVYWGDNEGTQREGCRLGTDRPPSLFWLHLPFDD